MVFIPVPRRRFLSSWVYWDRVVLLDRANRHAAPPSWPILSTGSSCPETSTANSSRSRGRSRASPSNKPLKYLRSYLSPKRLCYCSPSTNAGFTQPHRVRYFQRGTNLWWRGRQSARPRTFPCSARRAPWRMLPGPTTWWLASRSVATWNKRLLSNYQAQFEKWRFQISN